MIGREIHVTTLQPLEPSEELEHNEGRVSKPTDLAQAIVANRDLISKISSAIWSNISQNVRINVSECSKENTAIPEGHAELSNPVVSLDQTGTNPSTNINENPTISVDQSGTETCKRSSDELTELTHNEVPVLCGLSHAYQSTQRLTFTKT